MIKIQIKDIFLSGLGIFAEYKKELMNSSFGGLQRLEKKILSEKFMGIEDAAFYMNCCVTSARRKLYASKVRFIQLNEKFYFLQSDVKEQMPPIVKKPKKEKLLKKIKPLSKKQRKIREKIIIENEIHI